MTDRRAFIGSIAAGLFVAPQPCLRAAVGEAFPGSAFSATSRPRAWDGFRRGLRELGYVEGRNLTIEWRWAEGRADRYPDLAAELVRMKVDLIVTSSTPATQAAKGATGSIPILMTNSSFPEKVGLVETLARPGGNVTGFSNVNPQLVGKRLELIKEIAPRTSRLAALWNPTNPVEAMGLHEITTAAALVGGLEVVSVEVRTPEEHPAAFATMIARRVDGLQVFGNPVNFKNMQLIADFALTNRIVSSYEDRSFVDAGGLFSYASSFTDTYRRSATYVDKILKGAKPADLPIQHPAKFEFVLNLKTAKALGLTVPGGLLMRVDDLVQ